MKQKVLITGASGFIGLHLIEAALAMGLDVDAGVRKTSRIDHLSKYPVGFVYLDFTDKDHLLEALEAGQYQYIIHAAGVTRAGSQSAYNTVNADYTDCLAKAVQEMKHPVKKLIYISSLAAVGPLQQPDDLISEQTPPAPVTMYGKSKLLAEEQLSHYDLPWVILRPTAVYGPGDKDIFILMKAISRGIEPYIGKAPQQLSFIFVKDLAVAAVNTLFSEHYGQAYIISDGQVYDRYDLANITKHWLDKRTLRVHVPTALMKTIAASMERAYGWFHKIPVINREKLNELQAINWGCNISKARLELGFEPSYNLRNGLPVTLDWYRQHQWL